MLPLVQELICLNPGVNKALSGNMHWLVDVHSKRLPSWMSSRSRDGFVLAAYEDREYRLRAGISSVAPGMDILEDFAPLELTNPAHAINVLKRYKELLLYVTTEEVKKIPECRNLNNPEYQYETIIPAMMVRDCSAGSGFRFGSLVHVAFSSGRRIDEATYDCHQLKPESFPGTDGFNPALMMREYYVYKNHTAIIGDTINASIEKRLGELLSNSLFLEIEHELVLGMMEFEVGLFALPYFYAHTMLESFFPYHVRGSTAAIRLRHLLHDLRKSILMVDSGEVCYPVTPAHITGPGCRYARSPNYLG